MISDEVLPFYAIIQPLIDKLDLAGCHPENNSIISKFWWNFLFITNIFWMYLSFVQFARSDNLSEMIDIIVSVACLTQLIFALLTFRVYRKHFIIIFKTIENKFWFDKNIADEEIINKHNSYYRILPKINSTYQSIVYIALISWIIEPILYSTRTFPVNIALPYKNIIYETPYYEITYILQVVTFPTTAIYAVLLTDLLYISFVAFALIQINLIKEKMKRVICENDDEIKIHEKLRQCVVHHNLILNFLENIEQLYRYFMLNKLLCDIFCLCCTSYLYSQQKNLNVKLLCILAASGSQPFFYCCFGDFITSECESIGKEAYNINWQDLGLKSLNSSLSMIIMRSQKQVLMTAGGMVILSLPNYLAFMKMMFSFYILLKGESIK